MCVRGEDSQFHKVFKAALDVKKFKDYYVRGDSEGFHGIDVGRRLENSPFLLLLESATMYYDYCIRIQPLSRSRSGKTEMNDMCAITFYLKR